MSPPRVTVWETYIWVRIGTWTLQCPRITRQNVYLIFPGHPILNCLSASSMKVMSSFFLRAVSDWLLLCLSGFIPPQLLFLASHPGLFIVWLVTNIRFAKIWAVSAFSYWPDFCVMAVHWISCYETSMYMRLVLVVSISRSALLTYNSWLHDMHGLLTHSLKWKAIWIQMAY